MVKAVTLERMSNHSAALEELEFILNKIPRLDKSIRFDALLRRGMVLLFKKEKVEEAMADFEQARDLNPSDPRPVVFLGECLERKKMYKEADEMFSKAEQMQGVDVPGLEKALKRVRESRTKKEEGMS
eukprot:TRINITY_DN1731_c0_g1_i2.p2 TRINITY_DN1731_c0_g1~~TRINITY_DN1731_c0_g1_i2.p2  ORF type:complete len:128 (+),score=55.64 TRINITY_DN1731_c0_g1_i2:141-524(+)